MLCYSIPEIILIDDDFCILNTLELLIKKYLSNNVIVKTFNNSRTFKDYFIKNVTSATYVSDLYFSYLNKTITASSLLEEIDCFYPIIIIDQNLENNQKGSKICEFIREYHQHVFICLLTGEIDFETAVNLHNNKVIDFFLKKDNGNIISIITERLKKIIINRKLLFKFDGEIPLNNDIDVLYQHFYLKNLGFLLSSLDYKSYLILNSDGDLMVKMIDKEIKLYKYNPQNGKFKDDDSNNSRFYQ